MWIFFVLFFLVTIAEIGYYFFYDSLSRMLKIPIPPFSSTINQEKTSPPTPIKKPSPPATQTAQETAVDENQAISEDVIKTLKTFKKDTLTFAVLVTYFSGTIIEIEIGEATTDWGYKYGAKLKIRGEEGGINTFIFSQAELDHLQVFKKSGIGDDQTINFDQLKVGDQVTVKALLDLMRGIEGFQIETITLFP